jgi:DNA excision repair protein ERCC-3
MINSDEDSNSPALVNLNTTELKIDHSNRPLWINSKGRIILESFSALAKEAEDLLLAIAEPITRPKFMHEYQISSYSLYAAVSVGLEPESIIQALSLFCKTQLPKELQSYILNITKSFGKVKLILKDNKFWLQSKDPSILIELLKDNEVVEARVEAEKDLLVEDDLVKIDFKTPRKEVEIIPEHVDLFEMFDDKELDDLDPDQYLHNEYNVIADVDHPNGKDESDFTKEHFMNNVIPDPDQDDSLQVNSSTVHSFEIKKDQVENIKRKCSDLAYPVLEEYDFRADLSNTTLDIGYLNTYIRFKSCSKVTTISGKSPPKTI